jgi:hypothetical protein
VLQSTNLQVRLSLSFAFFNQSVGH